MKGGISIIVPFLNEKEGIYHFCTSLDNYSRTIDFAIELIFVDDGSADNTGRLISEFAFQNIKCVKLITLSKNCGSHAAIRAGLIHASYGICTWMGSDLQEPIEFLELSYQKIIQGCDAVYVEKQAVKVPPVERMFSKTFAFLIKKYAIPSFATGGVSNIVFNEKIKRYINDNCESNSAINLQIMAAGFHCEWMSLKYSEREFGKSKWTLSKKIKLFIDSFVSFSFMPIRLVSLLGFIMFFFGIAFGLYVIIMAIISTHAPAGYATLACLISLGFGMTNISLGIIAEYLWRTYDAARGRPTFIIADTEQIVGDEIGE